MFTYYLIKGEDFVNAYIEYYVNIEKDYMRDWEMGRGKEWGDGLKKGLNWLHNMWMISQNTNSTNILSIQFQYFKGTLFS